MPLRGHSLLSILPFMAFLSLVTAPAITAAETAQSIVQEMQARKTAREQGVQSYILVQDTAGQKTVLLFEKDPGNKLFRMIPPSEVATDQANQEGWTPSNSKEAMAGMAAGSILLRRALQQELGLSENDPAMTAAQNGIFGMLQMAAGLPTTDQYFVQKRKDAADVKQKTLDIAEFGRMATLTGTETLHGREAYVLQAEGLDREQVTEDGTFTIHTAGMWVDTQNYVPLRIRFEGVAETGGRSQPMVIERDSFDYRNAASLYLPYHEISRISGILNDKQKAEMKRAQQELKKLEDLQGPEKEMVMRMMGPQLQMIENMAKGRGIEVETIVRNVIVPATRATYVETLKTDGIR